MLIYNNKWLRSVVPAAVLPARPSAICASLCVVAGASGAGVGAPASP
jgi:hypothetical protein